MTEPSEVLHVKSHPDGTQTYIYVLLHVPASTAPLPNLVNPLPIAARKPSLEGIASAKPTNA
jgi:hypothetical protein